MNITMTCEIQYCPSCGVQVVAPEHYFKKRREDGRDIYCPNGHIFGWFGEKAEINRLRAQVQRERQAKDQAKAAAKEAERQAAIALQRVKDEQAKASRVRRRVGNGTCPCCKRTFKQLARHMQCKHPDYAPEGTHVA